MTTPQRPNPVKPWYKKVWIWVIVAVIIVGVSLLSNLLF